MSRVMVSWLGTVIGMRTTTMVLAGFWALVSAEVVSAAEVTRVLSTRNVKDRDIHVSLSWDHDAASASIRREYVQSTGTLVINDVLYHQVRDSMQLRAETSVYHDLSFFLAASFVLADNRGLDFDRSGACATGDCVETLLDDKILPGSQNTSWGLDAENGRPFQSPSNHVFSGPTRKGFEYLGLGLRWAAMNQARDNAKPTWTIGMETRFSVAGDQRFDPGKPTANRSVGLGYHQFILSTMFSRRFGAFEPSMGGWFMQPWLTSGSVYKDIGTGPYSAPQRQLGGALGVEATVWEDLAQHARFALEADGRVDYRLEGLAQSELWEVLSGDSRCTTDATFCRTGIDVDKAGLASPNPGVVRSPAYGVFGGDAGLSAHFGRFARLRGLFGMRFQEGHFLTDGSSGNSVYDVPGRRFRVESAHSWHILLDVTATFATF
jgi:hypothetical protein